MPERMDRSSFHASGIVVLYDSKPQGVLCEEIPKLITKEIVRTVSCPNCHVIPKDSNHGRTERNYLNLTVLRVPENDLFSGKVYILNLNVSHCGSPTAAVEQEIDDDPIPILTKVAVGFGLQQFETFRFRM